jgi:glycosyltransferase involved in cell wall biosynthesis
MKPPTPTVSLVIPTYNQRPLLERLLNSVETLEFKEPFEVIVVDDYSRDDTEAFLISWATRPHRFQAHYVRMAKNSGPAAARNEGARQARGRIVAYTDSDCVVTPSWLKTLVAPLSEENRIVGVGGRVLSLGELNAVSRYYVFMGTLEPPYNVNYLVTCNACFLREPLLAVGGFPEGIRIPGGEDVAASILLWKQGWRFVFEKNAVVYHDFRGNLRNFYKTWWNYGYGVSRVLHGYLSHEELYSELHAPTDENFWPAVHLRPSITGVRSFLWSSQAVWRRCREGGLGFSETVSMLSLYWFERFAHSRGWQVGRREPLPIPERKTT